MTRSTYSAGTLIVGCAVMLGCSQTPVTRADSSDGNVTPPAVAECGSPKPGWIWCDDFETNRLASYYEILNPNGSLTRVDGVGRDGSVGIRSRFAAAQVAAGVLAVAFGRTPDPYFKPVDAGTKDYREIYWRFYVRNQAGWVGGGGDKLTRLIVFAGSNWQQAAIAHVWSGASPGPDQNYLLIDPASGTDAAGALKTTSYNDVANYRWLGLVKSVTPIFDAAHVGAWHCVEVHVKLNAAGQSDGVFDVRIDGQLEANKTGINWLGSYSAYGINTINLENYWNNGSPVAQERYFDNYVISEAPIGC